MEQKFLWRRGSVHSFGETKKVMAHSKMMEINLLNRSSFEWVDLYRDNSAFISSGFNAWGGVFLFDGHWYSIGGKR